MADITLDHLTKVFDKTVVAVADLTIHIPTGCVVSLLGPSGCGKTTTMRMIAGLEKPTEGRILINDKKDYYILDADVFRYQTDAIKLKEIAAGSAKPETLYPKPGWTERDVQIPSLYLRE